MCFSSPMELANTFSRVCLKGQRHRLPTPSFPATPKYRGPGACRGRGSLPPVPLPPGLPPQAVPFSSHGRVVLWRHHVTPESTPGPGQVPGTQKGSMNVCRPPGGKVGQGAVQLSDIRPRRAVQIGTSFTSALSVEVTDEWVKAQLTLCTLSSV